MSVSEETIEAGTGTFSFCLEKTVYPETTVGEEAATLTATYEQPADGASGTGAISSFTLQIGGETVTIESFSFGTGASSREVYTGTVSDGTYAGTFVITLSVSASVGRSIYSIEYTPAE